MTDLKQTATLMTPRRGFFTRIAGVMALGVAVFVPTAPHAEGDADDGPDWPGKLTGRHKQVTDMYAVNDGFPLGFVHNFLEPNKSATGVVILRHEAFPLALNHTMWEKYKIGEAEKINDPETKAPAVKNPYFQAKPGVLRNDNAAIDKLLARGTVFGACSCRAAGPCAAARQECQRHAGRSRQGICRQHHPGDHGDPVRRMGRQPRPGGRLHLLRGRLIFSTHRIV